MLALTHVMVGDLQQAQPRLDALLDALAAKISEKSQLDVQSITVFCRASILKSKLLREATNAEDASQPLKPVLQYLKETYPDGQIPAALTQIKLMLDAEIQSLAPEVEKNEASSQGK